MIQRINQFVHDQCINNLASELSLEGWTVEADIPNWDQPSPISGYVPDIIARNSNRTRIYEVETEDTLERDYDQQNAFRQYAKHDRKVSFWMYLVDDEGNRTFLE
jgi:hypothetical protein